MRKKRAWPKALTGLLLPVIAVIVVLCFFTALNGLETGWNDEGREQLENAIRRSAVACYAAEGIYPPTLDYLEEHYGLQVDSSRYTVDYRIFGSNIMPDITVLENKS